jgi:hypothetical protein
MAEVAPASDGGGRRSVAGSAVVFAASKDRPILFTALAWADVLLTLDKADFADVLGGTFYGLRVMLPYDFLQHERAAGRL